MSILITVPFDPQRLSPNKRLSWQARAGRTAAIRALARWCWIASGSPQAEGPVTVSVVIYRSRMIDNANVWACLKAPMDGLFVNAITPDDSPRWVSLGPVSQCANARYANREEVLFVVETWKGKE